MARFTRVADGNITPYSFVVFTTAAGRIILATGTTVPLWGISFPGQRNAPWAPLQDTYAAVQGENCGVYGPGETEVLIQAGGTITQGDYLTSDGSGHAITTTTTGQWVGAQALQGAKSGDLVSVRVFSSYEY